MGREKTPSPATFPHILSLALPTQGLGEPNLQKRKAFQLAQLAPNKPPQLCHAEHPRQHPPAQRSEDALPTLGVAGIGAELDQPDPPLVHCQGAGRTHRGAGRTRQAGRTCRLLSPTFWCAAPQGSGSGVSLMLLPSRQLLETGHRSHPATISPRRGPACCHTLLLGSPAGLPKAWG